MKLKNEFNFFTDYSRDFKPFWFDSGFDGNIDYDLLVGNARETEPKKN